MSSSCFTGTWENGEEVCQDIQDRCDEINLPNVDQINKYCEKEITGDEIKWIDINIPPPNCNRYAVLEKPGVDLTVGRGCQRPGSNPDRGVCDETSFCQDCTIDNSDCQKCSNSAPGGLADFNDPMSVQGEQFLKNGFIMNKCECNSPANWANNTTDNTAEIWDGVGRDCRTILQDIGENYFQRDSCQQYIQKYAKTCEWCQQNAPETGCAICNSPLWKYVPGGWEAVVDPSNPYHLLAREAYINKRQERRLNPGNKENECSFDTQHVAACEDNVGGRRCRQRYVGISTFNQETGQDEQDNVEPTWVDFCNSGPISRTGGDVPAFDNLCSNLCCNEDNLNCPQYSWGDGDNVYDRTDYGGDNCANINALETCGYSETPGLQDVKPRGLLMCERNPQLLGQGESKEDNTESSARWVRGLYKLYQNPFVTGGNIPPEDLKKREIEAMRCCLGLTPGYDSSTGTNTTTREDCLKGAMCPNNEFCKQLFTDFVERNQIPNLDTFLVNELDTYQFVQDYPEGYKNEGSPQLSDEIMSNPNLYLKTYCQMAGGGADPENTAVCGHDKDIDALCRKVMLKHCSEPVTVQSDQLEYATDTITFPFRIFTDQCQDWCKINRYDKVLPNQSGLCDMINGEACQKLQVEGWINPVNWNTSEILNIIPKTWSEKDRPENVYTNFDSKHLMNSCGCFLMGSQCVDSLGNPTDCSYHYCGAGTAGYGTSQDTAVNEPVDLNAYGINKTTPQWTTSSNTSLTCIDPPGTGVQGSNCYKGCNYTNFYDVCWNASGEERKGPRGAGSWICDFSEDFSQCEPSVGGYGCQGYCSDSNPNLPNCGTQSWFNETLGLSPNEKIKKEFQLNFTQDWPKWQNYYSEYLRRRDSISGCAEGTECKYEIPGWGNTTINTAKDKQCYFPACRNNDSVKPYRIAENPINCGTTCTVSMTNTVNNDGTIVGGVTSVLDGSDACQFDSDTFFGSIMDSDDKYDYANLLGSNECSDYRNCINQEQPQDCTEQAEICFNNSSICIDSETGDNCQICNTPNRQNVCCMIPSLATDADKNQSILDIVNDHISYYCYGDECEDGTTSLNLLEAQQCPVPCTVHLNQQDCESSCPIEFEDSTSLNLCVWDQNDQVCKASCPKPPPEGWGMVLGTEPPTTEPVEPTSPPPAEKADDIDIGIIVGSTVGGLALLVLLVVVFVYFL